MHKCTIGIFYSEEDEGYIAVVPELPGCSAFGETEEEALKEIKVAIELRLEVEQAEKKKVIHEAFNGDYLRLLTERADFRSSRESEEEEEFAYGREDAFRKPVFS